MTWDFSHDDPGIEGLTAYDLAGVNDRLENASADEVLHWVLTTFGHLRIGLTSAFGPEGCALVDLARRQRSDIPVFTIDTGLLFPETIAVREAYRAAGANIVVVEPLVTLRRQAQLHGPDLHEREPDRCCGIRKVEPMRRVLDVLDVWVTAIRRDQSETRKDTPIVGTAERRDGSRVLKIAPLAQWTRKETWSYLLAHELPYNRLLDEGYRSIGCRPCTRPAADDQSERAGRWTGHAKTECGIHNL